MNIHSLLYRVTGRMTNTQMVRTAEKIGLDLAAIGQKNGDIFVEDVQKVLESNIGKKAAERITISGKFSEFKEFVAKHLGIPEDTAIMFFDNSKAAAVPGGKSNKFFFKINMESFDGILDKVNTISHECEHLLHQGLSFKAFFDRLQIKIKGNKWFEKYTAKYADLVNQKSMMLQVNLIGLAQVGENALGGFTKFKKGVDGLLAQTEFPSIEEMHKFLKDAIRKYILLPQGDKRNLTLINALRMIIKDESRAYKVGGKVERSLYPQTERLTKSEMVAQFYDETLKVLTKERKLERKNRIREFFGFARKDS